VNNQTQYLGDESSPVVLFDMDGTLTPPRQPIKSNMIKAINSLRQVATVGIVTGSSLSSIQQQCSPFLHPQYQTLAEDLLYFPCNGTQHCYWDPELRKFESVFCTNMYSTLGESAYQQLIRILIHQQTDFIDTYDFIPVVGTFFEYRNSLLNWSPVGRDAAESHREYFIDQDMAYNIRNGLLERARDLTQNIPITIVKGGQTSFDIYPVGWDKTYVLNHFASSTPIWFIGDKCEGDGNDRTLYEAIEPTKAFSTNSPAQTIKIINGLIKTIRNTYNEID